MECSELLARASEWLDEQLPEVEVRRLESHLSYCSRCREYHSSLIQSLELVRSLPELEISSDFRHRLTHRIYHVEDGASIARESLGSGVTTLAVLAVAALMAFVAWTPRARTSETTVELPAIVVARPRVPNFNPRPGIPTLVRRPSIFSTVDFQDGLWGEAHQTLFRYSSLSERRREQPTSRVGLQ